MVLCSEQHPCQFGIKQNVHYGKSLSQFLPFHTNYPVCCPLSHDNLPGTVPDVSFFHLVMSFTALLHDLLFPGLRWIDVSSASPIVLLDRQSPIVNLLEILKGRFLYCSLETHRALWHNSNSFYLEISVRIDLNL